MNTQRNLNFNSIEIDGIDMSDYPDFCDAFVCYAEWENGQPLTEQELDQLNDDHSLRGEIVQQRAHDFLDYDGDCYE